MNLAAVDHISTLVFGSLVTTATGAKIEVSKLTGIFMPSIISGLFSLSTYSCSLECSTSSLSTSMFLLLLSDSLFMEIAMNSFLVMLLEILWAFFIWVVKAPVLKKGFSHLLHLYCCLGWIFVFVIFISCFLKRSWFLDHRFMLVMAGLELFICPRTPIF